jgi:hypothetical protein
LRTAQVAAVPGARELAPRIDGVIEGLGAVILVGLRDRVEALGAQVWLTSPVGAGTTLRAAIPLHGPPATGLVPTGSTPADGAGGGQPSTD